uniref:C2H2-type domain-containing protein n=1 Tax=Cyprinus carpio TaxID=7962 RepID=A0A8C2DT44_CYPCA
MTKLQLLHRALNERLMAAVEQIMEMVGDTVLEYEEETIRARKENEVLRRRLRWMEGANRADWPGPSEPVTLSTMDEANPSRQDECAVNFAFGQESEALEIKTESTDLPLCIRPESSVTTFPPSIDQGSDNAGTGAGIAYGLTDTMTWDSGQSYMAPLDFDPTSGPSRVRRWRGRNRRQRMSFACPDCGKVFGSKQRLMVHMRIHSTERPYAYRRRKACFYGDNKKKRKLHRLSQLSREIVDDLSDGSEQTNRSSASPEQLETTAPGQEEEPESDHTSCGKGPEKRITIPVRNQHEKKRVVNQMCQCPHCPHRVFARPCQLAMHMKTHTVTALVNLPTQAQSGTREIVDVKRKLPKRQRKKDVEKEAKVADKPEFHCPDCDKVFLYASRLHFHMKSHKSKRALLRKTQPVKTEVTKEETTVALPKTTEVQNLKELKKTYACPHCDKVFTREGWLVPHIRSQHQEVKNRSDYVNVFGSGRTRSQQPFTMQFRKRTTKKRGEVTKKLRLENRKTKKSRRVKAKPRQTSDESTLVVDVSTITNDEAEQSADPLKMGTDEAQKSADLLKTGTDKAQKSADCLKMGTDEVQQCKVLLKTGTDEAEQSADLPNTGTDEAQQSADLPKTRTDEAEQSAELPKTVTDEAQQSADLPKTCTDEAEQSAELPKTVTDEAQQSAELPKTGTDEAQQSADLPKTGTDESESPSEQSKDISGSDRGTSSTKNLKRMFPCKTCGKEFVLEKRLKKHSRKHIGRRLQDEKKRRREQAVMEMELEEQEKRRSEEKERLDDKMSTSNHNPNTATSQGSPKKEPLQKSRTRAQGPLPCPFCGKVFAWEMRLLMHMQIHCGEKPYAYRQRERRFYGDPKRGQLPKIHNQEPSGDKSDESEESGSEETVNKDRSAHLGSSATHAVSGALASSIETTVPENHTGSLLPQRAIEQPTTSYKSNQRTKPELLSDITSHFSLQPRIVLQPIMTEYKYWSSVPRVADLKSGCSEKSSGFDHKQTSYSVLVDDEMVDAVEDKIVDSNLCTLPLEFSSHGIHNKPEICHTGNPETEVVFVEAGSPQRDSEVELDNIGGPLAFESPEGKNVENQQKDDHNFNFPGVSDKTARNQVSVIVIDDEVEESNARTAAENALSECGRTKCDWKCDCKNISAMKLTVMPESSILQSLFKETSSGTIQKNTDSKLVCVVLSDIEDNVDEDVSSPSKGLDKKKTVSDPSIQNEQLDVGNKSGKNPSSNSNFPAPDATEPTKSSQLTDDHSISNDPLRDQMAFNAIRQTEDRPMSSKEGISCQTSDMVFAGQESLSEVHADKKLLDMKITDGGERKNKKLGLNNQMSESVLDDSANNFEISGTNEPSVQNVKTCELLVKSSEEFEMPLFTPHQTSDGRCQTAVSSEEQKKGKQALYCRFCEKACKKIELHLKCDHAKEPEVVKALNLDTDCKERKWLLSSFAIKKNFNQPRDSRIDCDEDIVHCIFCHESFQWNKFREHALICKHNMNPAASSKSQEMFDAELGNLAPGTISFSRPLEPTNAPVSNLSDLHDHPIPETRICEVKENHTLVSDRPQILCTTDSPAQKVCDPKSSSPPNHDSCQSAALKTNYPEVKEPTVSNIDGSIPQIDLDTQSLKPSVLDSCQCSAIHPPHLESSFSTSRNPDVKIPEPPILDSCQTIRVVESTVPTLPISNTGCSVLQQSLIKQTDHPRIVNQPSSSDTEVSCDLEPDGYSSCGTGCCDSLQLSSKPKDPSSPAPLNSSSKCNADSKCTLKLAVFDDTYLGTNETEQAQDSDVERNIFMVSGSSDVHLEPESHHTPDPNSYKVEQTQCQQPESIENPDADRSGNQPTADLELKSVPSVQEIKSRAIGHMSYLKLRRCDLQEDPEKITDENGNDCAVEVQHDSSISVTSKQKRKRVYQIGLLKEESKKSCPSSHSQGPGCQTNSTDDNSSVFKIHHCFYCKQPHNRMMDHLQSVHPNEPEVAEALTFDKSSQERKQLLNLLQTRGNVLHNTNMVQSSKQDLKPFGKFALECSFDDSVYCIYCLGLFNKKSFVSHLEQCKGKSTQSAEDSCGEMLPNAGPIPPAPTLVSPSRPEEIDANIEPSGFHCINTIYETDFKNEQGRSSLPDLSCNVEQPDISSPNDEVRNSRQAEDAFLQFRHSPENEVGYELKSGNSSNPSTGKDSTDCKNKGASLPKCDVDQERALTPTSDTSSDTSPHPEYDVLRNPCDDFSPPENAQTVSDDTHKSSVKAQTCGTGKKRSKRRSHVHNQPLIMDDDLLGEGEMSSSELHVCQHCKETFGSPYMLRRHEYTHTGDTPSSAYQEKLKRAKRLIQDGETSMRDDASIEPSTKSPEDLPNAVTDDTGGKVADTKQDTEERESSTLKKQDSKVKDYDTDCEKILFTS